jgi:hypothetical protein
MAAEVLHVKAGSLRTFAAYSRKPVRWSIDYKSLNFLVAIFLKVLNMIVFHTPNS